MAQRCNVPASTEVHAHHRDVGFQVEAVVFLDDAAAARAGRARIQHPKECEQLITVKASAGSSGWG